MTRMAATAAVLLPRSDVSSELSCAVDEHGYWSIVDQLDAHHRLELAGGHGHLGRLQFSHDCLIQRPRELRRRGLIERRSPSLPHISVERELRDDQDTPTHVDHGSIHGLAVALEDTHIANLRRD